MNNKVARDIETRAFSIRAHLSPLQRAINEMEEAELMAEALATYEKKYGCAPAGNREARRRFATIKRRTKRKRGRRDE